VNPLNALYSAVGWVLTRIYDVLKPVFGASSGWTWFFTIVILVMLMRLIMVPLFIKQMHATRAMSALQPQMTALRKKYKNDKQTLNQEMMKLYQEHGVNPLMGCLPFVLQLPLFFSLFSVLRAIAEYNPSLGKPPAYGLPTAMVTSAQHAKILGATIADKVLFTHGLAVPVEAKIVIFFFVMISMATTFLTIRQSMKRGMMPAATSDNPMAASQKYMQYIMPFFALTGLYWQFGLVLYWVTTNVWTLGQQYLLGRRYPYTPPAAEDGVGTAPGKGVGRTATASALTSGPNRVARGAAGTGGKAAARGKAGADGAARGSSTPAANGKASGTGGAAGGMLRRLSKGRSAAEPQPEEPAVKLVRHQTQRQSRSKRSGRR
jgi:YidC/Oxa1 family membrane protein insertase